MPGEQASNRYLIGFWLRFAAAIFDTLIVGAVLSALVAAVLGPETFHRPASPPLLAVLVFSPGLYLVAFWKWRCATPGEWLVSHQVRDFRTGRPPTLWQCLLRWLCMYLSVLPLFLGCIWIAWGRDNRAWHDRLASTVVVSDDSYRPLPEDRVFRPGGAN